MRNIQDLIHASGGIITRLIVTGAALALLVFLWGLAVFIFKSGSEAGQKEGKNRMVWGIIYLFVMLSVWGIVYFIRVAFGLDAYVPPDPGFRKPIPSKTCTFDTTLQREICL